MSWVATAIVGGAVIGAGATAYSAHKASKASQQAATVQAVTTKDATDKQLEFLRESKKDLSKAIQQGIRDIDINTNKAIMELDLDDLNAIQEYANILSNPEIIMQRPEVQFQYEQGLDALQSAFSRVSGGGLSGRMIKAAEEYGQNFASTMLDRELKRLEPLISQQVNVANLYRDWGTSKANLRVGGEAQVAGLTGQYAPAIAKGIQTQGNIAAQNAINQSNIATSAIENFANLGNDALWTYAIYKKGLLG